MHKVVKQQRKLKLALCIGSLFTAVPSAVFAQIPDQPLNDAERPLTSLAPAEQDKVVEEQAQTGNIFKRKPGAKHSYWDNLEGHLTVEAGIAGNPWTKSGRNFAQFYVDRANTVQLNQILGSLSHPVEDIGHGYGIGFVIEDLYGSDGRFDPTIGMGSGALNGLYQWVPTQAHIDVKFPWLFKNGIDVQFGQMYGLIGAEGTPALARPFYSFGYASDYIVPFEMIGVVATMHITDHYDWILGVDAGESTSFGASSNNSRPKGWFGFAAHDLMDGRLNAHLIGHFGPEQNNRAQRLSPSCNGNAGNIGIGSCMGSIGIGRQANDYVKENADIMVSYKLNNKMTVTVDGTWVHDDYLRADAYGVSTFFAYDINPNLTFNARGEIFRDNTGLFITEYSSYTSFTKAISNQPYPYYNALPTTYGELTVGVSYRPEFINSKVHFGQFTFRPEMRLDKSLNGTNPFNRGCPSGVLQCTVNNGTNNMLWFNADAIWNF